jgi:hypothetical protein
MQSATLEVALFIDADLPEAWIRAIQLRAGLVLHCLPG